jgi:hypothetical protein
MVVEVDDDVDDVEDVDDADGSELPVGLGGPADLLPEQAASAVPATTPPAISRNLRRPMGEGSCTRGMLSQSPQDGDGYENRVVDEVRSDRTVETLVLLERARDEVAERQGEYERDAVVDVIARSQDHAQH